MNYAIIYGYGTRNAFGQNYRIIYIYYIVNEIHKRVLVYKKYFDIL